MSHFGLHRHDGLVFLHEQEGGRCLTPRLDGLESPVTVKQLWWLPCPHRLGPPEPGPVLDHPFVRAMGPDQAGRLFHVRPQDVNWIWRLAEMAPSFERFVEPYYTLRRPRVRRVAPKLTLTNAAPMALVDLGPGDTIDMEQLVRLPRIRNLILSGPIRFGDAETLDPAGLDWNHDWAAEGRRQLHAFVRRVSEGACD